MRTNTRRRIFGIGSLHLGQGLYGAVAVILCFGLVGCAKIGEIARGPDSEQVDYRRLVHTPTNFDVALKENQAAQAQTKIAADVALFNTGVILAHPSNPKKDYSRAVVSFRALVAEHPQSPLVEQSKTWIQVIEQQQKLSDERQKLADEKRALIRERELLLQERQKLNYTNEKSRQLDLEIEKRRRQSLSK